MVKNPHELVVLDQVYNQLMEASGLPGYDLVEQLFRTCIVNDYVYESFNRGQRMSSVVENDCLIRTTN